MINEFVEKIVVHERDRKGSQTSKQKIEIYFNFIGNYELPQAELSDEEKQKLEEEERKNKEKKRQATSKLPETKSKRKTERV